MKKDKLVEFSDVTRFQDKSLLSWKIDRNSTRPLMRELEEKAMSDKEVQHVRSVRRALNNISRGTIQCHRVNGNRIFNSMVRLHRKMRRYVYSDNGMLVQIDTANSHPLLMVNKFLKEGIAIEQDAIDAVEQGTLYDILITAFKAYRESHEDDMFRFKKAEDIDRDYVKKKMFTIMYNKEGIAEDNLTYAVLKDRFPILAQSIYDLADKGGLAMEMQRIESEIWIDSISVELMNRGILHVSCHDSVVFEAKDVAKIKEVEGIVREAYGDISPSLHIEQLDGSEIII